MKQRLSSRSSIFALAVFLAAVSLLLYPLVTAGQEPAPPPETVDALLERLETLSDTEAARLIETSATSTAAMALERLTAVRAGAILSSISTEKRTAIVTGMTVASLEERLPEVEPEKLFEISDSVLLEKLPGVSAELLTADVPPQPDPALAPPTTSQLSDSLVVYRVPETGNGTWVTLVGSPAPIVSILAKFNRALTGLEVSVESLAATPTGSPSFDGGLLVNSVFSIDIANAEADDVAAAHVTLFVERSWLDVNDVHKWSIQLQSLDEPSNRWVPFQARRISETDERVFYSVVVPGFSVIAITGSPDLPRPPFLVSDLETTPAAPTEDQAMTVTARVTNISGSPGVFPAMLWIDDTVEEARTMPLEPGESATVSFEVRRGAGTYTWRIDREIVVLSILPAASTDQGETDASTPEPTAASEEDDNAGAAGVVLAIIVAAVIGSSAMLLIRRRRSDRPGPRG